MCVFKWFLISKMARRSWPSYQLIDLPSASPGPIHSPALWPGKRPTFTDYLWIPVGFGQCWAPAGFWGERERMRLGCPVPQLYYCRDVKGWLRPSSDEGSPCLGSRMKEVAAPSPASRVQNPLCNLG